MYKIIFHTETEQGCGMELRVLQTITRWSSVLYIILNFWSCYNITFESILARYIQLYELYKPMQSMENKRS